MRALAPYLALALWAYAFAAPRPARAGDSVDWARHAPTMNWRLNTARSNPGKGAARIYESARVFGPLQIITAESHNWPRHFRLDLLQYVAANYQADKGLMGQLIRFDPRDARILGHDIKETGECLKGTHSDGTAVAWDTSREQLLVLEGRHRVMGAAVGGKRIPTALGGAGTPDPYDLAFFFVGVINTQNLERHHKLRPGSIEALTPQQAYDRWMGQIKVDPR